MIEERAGITILFVIPSLIGDPKRAGMIKGKIIGRTKYSQDLILGSVIHLLDFGFVLI